MQINLISVGTRMPDWCETSFTDYAKRLPASCSLNLIEIPLSKRTKNSDIKRLVQEEGKKMLAAVPKGSQLVALDVKGKHHTTSALAKELEGWLGSGQSVSLLVGGPDGLAEECLAKANARWSLSNLTFPHPLVRVVIAEQIYRAWSILKGHPYHR